MISWFNITTAGSFSIMAPAAAIIVVWLALNRAWQLVLWWCLLFIGSMGVAVASKIAFIGWGIGIRSLNFTGFSGHALRAAAVAPVLLYLLLQKTASVPRKSGVLLGLVFAILIAWSRLEVNAHSVSEAIAGWLLGITVSLGFIWILSHSPKIELNPWVISLSLIGLLATPNITPVPTQRWITEAALYISGHDKPYIRATWKMASTKSRLSLPDPGNSW